LLNQIEPDMPSRWLVPRKFCEMGAQPMVIEKPSSAGKNLVVSDVKLIRG
jgi:hypothetical protein